MDDVVAEGSMGAGPIETLAPRCRQAAAAIDLEPLNIDVAALIPPSRLARRGSGADDLRCAGDVRDVRYVGGGGAARRGDEAAAIGPRLDMNRGSRLGELGSGGDRLQRRCLRAGI